MFCKVTVNPDLTSNGTVDPRGNTGLSSCESLIAMSFLSTDHYLTLFYMCFLFKSTLINIY